MPVHSRTIIPALAAALGTIDTECSTIWKHEHHTRRNRALVLAALTALACRGSTEVVQERVAGIYSNIAGTLFGNDSLQAQAWVVGFAGDSIPGRTVALSALTPAIATISSAGVIHTHGDGFALFLATSAGVADTFSLQVFVTRIARITATPDSVSLVVGDSLDVGDEGAPFHIRAFDASGNEMHDVPVSFTSSDPRVVMKEPYFDEIVAKGVGTAVLTAKSDTASTTILVTVTASP